MFQSPSELQIFGLYLPPAFLVCTLGLVSAIAITQLFNRLGVSRLFWHPPLAFVALWVLAASLIGLLLITP